MKFHPQHIIYWAVVRYLNKKEIHDLKTDLVSSKSEGDVFIQSKIHNHDTVFISKIKKHIDLERLNKNPLIWQDAWIYNYIQYEAKTTLPKKGLIAKYEKQIFLPAFLASRKEANSK